MSTRRAELIQQLFDTMHATLSFFDQPEEALNRSYGPGKWTMRQILCHISDQETVFLERLRRIATESNATLLNMDENVWVKDLFYSTRDLAIIKMQFEAARRSVIELMRRLDESIDEKRGTHTLAGPVTFAQVAGKIAKHTAHHNEQLLAIAAGRSWQPKPS